MINNLSESAPPPDLVRPAPEPVDDPVDEPSGFVELAACADMILHTFRFPDDAVGLSEMLAEDGETRTFGWVVRDSFSGYTFAIPLVDADDDITGFAAEYNRWAQALQRRYTEGQRETIFSQTQVRALEPQFLERMLRKGIMIPALGVRGAVQASVHGAMREFDESKH